jgi:tetratricopeptide (TPR) repeat protein
LQLGGCHCDFGRLLVVEGALEESLEWLDKAQQILEPLAATAMSQPDARRFLRNCHFNRAVARDALGEFSLAVAEWDAAMEFSPPEEVNQFRVGRLASLVDAGSYAVALAEVEELTAGPRGEDAWSATQAGYFAGAYAAASAHLPENKEQNADRAMHWLKLAVERGIDSVEWLKDNPHLASLRERDDFKQLLAELEKP